MHCDDAQTEAGYAIGSSGSVR